jgi:hypothetical protein
MAISKITLVMAGEGGASAIKIKSSIVSIASRENPTVIVKTDDWPNCARNCRPRALRAAAAVVVAPMPDSPTTVRLPL